MKRTRVFSVVVAVAAGLGACSGTPKGMTGDPGVDARNADLQSNQRINSLDKVWAEAKVDPSLVKIAREASKDLLFKGKAPVRLRQKALAHLLTDTSAEGMKDTRHLLVLLMPIEGQWPMVQDFCKAVEDRSSDPAWKGLTAALVRSYARKVPIPPDEERPERAALVALHPGKDLTAIVFDVYIRPLDNGALRTIDDNAERSRGAAWELLARLDPDGSRRTALASAESSSDPAIKDINRCARELGVVPVTGSELAWLHRLMDDSDKRNALWWSQAMQAVGALGTEQKAGLQLRHIECVRWAASNRPEWLGSSRERLLSELGQRLSGRRVWPKTVDLDNGESRGRETLKDWQGQLVWGDLLAILLLDEVVHQPWIVAELYKQAAQDRADTSTEYGGVFWAADQGGVSAGPGAKFALRGYQARPIDRRDDRTFSAPEEMFADSARSLAHYHFHVQTANNADYAGPGRGDLEYAATHGRNCLVFTSVREGVMDVDYYQRNGAVIDLGEIAEGK